MDFALLKEHPWISIGSVVVGGFVLFLIFRRSGNSGSSSGDNAASGGPIYAGQPDPTTTAANAQIRQTEIAANAQTSQLSASLAGLNITSARDIQLATIAANSADLSMRAQLTLGLGTQQAIVDQARIEAGTQQSYINAILSALGFRSGSGTPGSPVIAPAVTTVPGVAGNPIVQVTGTINPSVPFTADAFGVIPGGQALIALPNYRTCSPFDTSCTDTNQALSTAYGANLASAQATNNRDQCVENAAYGGRTAAEQVVLIQLCRSTYV